MQTMRKAGEYENGQQGNEKHRKRQRIDESGTFILFVVYKKKTNYEANLGASILMR